MYTQLGYTLHVHVHVDEVCTYMYVNSPFSAGATHTDAHTPSGSQYTNVHCCAPGLSLYECATYADAVM